MRTKLMNLVLRSPVFYLGTGCEFERYSRESRYYRSEDDTQNDLDARSFFRF